MQLDEFIKSKCKWHLGYNQTSIPAGDLARIEEALNNAVSYTHLTLPTTSRV